MSIKNKNIEKKFLPEEYRYLKEGEPIKQGDYFWGNKNNKWKKIRYPGDTSNWVKEQVIRKNEENKTNSG
jgi:SH3-like domain-containing protein